MRLPFKKKRSPTLFYVMATIMMILCICCLPGRMSVFGAEEAETASEDEDVNASVTFTNKKNTDADLYITKTVQTSSDDESDYSDVEFTFTLYLNGTVARQKEYTVWDENGNQVFPYEDGSESIVKESDAVAYLTSRYGVFTLKAGQTAKFSDLGAGTSYEVEEDDTDGFTQIVPSGGANAVGTIEEDGATITFTNLADFDDGTSSLRIYKTVSFPNGWTLLDFTVFSFNITISGDVYSYEDYDVYSSSTGLLVETRTTDEYGNFSLSADEYAVFKTEADLDYCVTENETEGWWVTTDKTVEGSTGTSAQTIVYNNASASFIVTKSASVDEGKEGEVDVASSIFSFVLSDSEGDAWSGADYWLYNTDGTPVLDDDNQMISLETDDSGEFTLSSGQAAVFYGIESGAGYNVSEKKADGWKQTVPLADEGYTNKSVTDAVEILPFENEYVGFTGTIMISKTVEALSGIDALTDDEFTFCLYDENDSPIADLTYSITCENVVSTYSTGDDGMFTIHAGETAVFDDMPFGVYSVKEASAPDRTHDHYDFSNVNVIAGEESTIYTADGASGTLDENGLSFEYVNTYTAPSSITIYKYKGDGTTYLSDVTFTLADADGNVLQEKTTGEDGKVCFDQLDAGTYTITETSTQDGYTLLVNSFTVTVPITMTKDEVKSSGIDTADAVWRSDTNLWYFFDVTYNVTNSAVLDLPETGGNGWFLSVIIGAMILTILILTFVYRRKKLTPVKKYEQKAGESYKQKKLKSDE